MFQIFVHTHDTRTHFLMVSGDTVYTLYIDRKTGVIRMGSAIGSAATCGRRRMVLWWHYKGQGHHAVPG